MVIGRRTAGTGKSGHGTAKVCRSSKRAAFCIDKEGSFLIMENVFDFLRAALPWIAVGLLLAVLIARGTSKKKKEKYHGDPMCATPYACNLEKPTKEQESKRKRARDDI